MYFTNLNVLSFIALMVILCHVELERELFGLPFLRRYPIFHNLGKAWAVLFISLSGKQEAF